PVEEACDRAKEARKEYRQSRQQGIAAGSASPVDWKKFGPRQRQKVVGVLLQVPQERSDLLPLAAKDLSELVRREAAPVLEAMPTLDAVVGPVLLLLRDDVGPVRRQAVNSLGRRQDKPNYPQSVKTA